MNKTDELDVFRPNISGSYHKIMSPVIKVKSAEISQTVSFNGIVLTEI